MSFEITKDTLSPTLQRMIKTSSNPLSVLYAGGTELKAIVKGSFRDPSLRISPWKKSKNQTGKTLIGPNALMRRSIALKKLGSNSVVVQTDRPYAPYNQYGTRPYIIRAKNKGGLANKKTGQFFGKVVNHPGLVPRPFFPFNKNGTAAPFAIKRIEAVMMAKLKKELGR